MKRLAIKIARFMGRADGSLATRTLRSGAWVGIGAAAANVLQTVRQIVLARLLSPEVFGLMGICLMLIRGLDLFTETGLGPALIHRQHDVERAKNTAFTLQMGRGVVLALLTWLLGPLAAAYWSEPRLVPITLWLSLGLVASGFANIDLILLSKKLDFRRLTLLDMSVTFLSTAVIITLAVVLRSVWALVIGQLVTAFLKVGLSYVVVRSRPTMMFDRAMARELLGYGRYITGLTIVLFITSEVDNVFVSKMLGLEALGLYTMAYALANLPATHISKVASAVVFPAYSALQNDLPKLRAAYLMMLRLAAGLAVPAAIGLAVLATEIVQVVYGDKWTAMVPALRVLTLFGAARSVGLLGGSVYNAIGRPQVSFYMSAVKLAVVLVALYPATKTYGLVGAAAAVAVPQVVGDVIGFFIIQRQIQLPVTQIFAVLGRILAACAVMAAVVLGLRSMMTTVGAPQLIGLVAAGMISYAVLRLNEMRALFTEVRGRRRPSAAPVAAPAS